MKLTEFEELNFESGEIIEIIFFNNSYPSIKCKISDKHSVSNQNDLFLVVEYFEQDKLINIRDILRVIRYGKFSEIRKSLFTAIETIKNTLNDSHGLAITLKCSGNKLAKEILLNQLINNLDTIIENEYEKYEEMCRKGNVQIKLTYENGEIVEGIKEVQPIYEIEDYFKLQQSTFITIDKETGSKGVKLITERGETFGGEWTAGGVFSLENVKSIEIRRY